MAPLNPPVLFWALTAIRRWLGLALGPVPWSWIRWTRGEDPGADHAMFTAFSVSVCRVRQRDLDEPVAQKCSEAKSFCEKDTRRQVQNTTRYTTNTKRQPRQACAPASTQVKKIVVSISQTVWVRRRPILHEDHVQRAVLRRGRGHLQLLWWRQKNHHLSGHWSLDSEAELHRWVLTSRDSDSWCTATHLGSFVWTHDSLTKDKTSALWRYCISWISSLIYFLIWSGGSLKLKSCAHVHPPPPKKTHTMKLWPQGKAHRALFGTCHK